MGVFNQLRVWEMGEEQEQEQEGEQGQEENQAYGSMRACSKEPLPCDDEGPTLGIPPQGLHGGAGEHQRSQSKPKRDKPKNSGDIGSRSHSQGS